MTKYYLSQETDLNLEDNGESQTGVQEKKNMYQYITVEDKLDQMFWWSRADPIIGLITKIVIGIKDTIAYFWEAVKPWLYVDVILQDLTYGIAAM